MRALVLALAVLLAGAPAQAQRVEEGMTEADIRAAWGEPAETRGNWLRYRMESGEELSLTFDPLAPFGLMYADLQSVDPDRPARRIFSHHPRAASRRLVQLDPCYAMMGTAYDIGGWPDFSSGSAMGVVYYEMANGDEVAIWPWTHPRGVQVRRKDGSTYQLPNAHCAELHDALKGVWKR
jgi:hypothetical protein